MNRFAQIKIGQRAEISHTITAEDVRKFTELSGDDNRLHTDAEFAAQTSFKKPLAHGMLGVSFISTIIGTKLPGDGALWFAQNLEFLLPVHVGDIITIRAKVIKKDERLRVIELQTDIINQYRQKVTQGIAKVKVIEQEVGLVKECDIKRLNKVALVIGGSGEIGSAVCLALAGAGFDVAIHYFKNVNSARTLAQKIEEKGRKACICACDITVQSEVDNVVQDVIRRLGPITVLVNCSTSKIAAIKFSELIWHDFELHLNNQIQGTFNLVRAVVPCMAQQLYGKIININSQALETPSSDWLPYITVKGALMGFSRALAFDLAPKGIRVNTVSPGMMESDLNADIPERVRLVTAAKTPLRRLASSKDVANAVVFLALEQSDFLCGETIRVNGGQVMI